MGRLWRTLSLFLLAFGHLAGRAQAQEAGLAVITFPLEGAIVSGVVALSGSATHPQFQRYELAFSYAPNTTGTWFSIQNPVPAPVLNGGLGQWDTSGIADGVYDVRLRVYWSDRDFLEFLTRGVQVQNAAPSATPTAEATPTTLPATRTPTPAGVTPGQAVAGTASAATPGGTAPPIPAATPVPDPPGGLFGGSLGLTGSVLRAAFLQGVWITVIIFSFLGLYAAARAAWRGRR